MVAGFAAGSNGGGGSPLTEVMSAQVRVPLTASPTRNLADAPRRRPADHPHRSLSVSTMRRLNLVSTPRFFIFYANSP
jgi:hypothetical protein